MTRSEVGTVLPPIPAKRYFTIGEVADLCGVKPHVLRYWEQEFTQLKPVKRRGNRRYYQHHEVLLIRRIRELLYEQGFTISGARNRLSDPNAAQIEESISLSKEHVRTLRSELTELSQWMTSALGALALRDLPSDGAAPVRTSAVSQAGKAAG
jgi:DNA-binding transcriptional MerR regulator